MCSVQNHLFPVCCAVLSVSKCALKLQCAELSLCNTVFDSIRFKDVALLLLQVISHHIMK